MDEIAAEMLHIGLLWQYGALEGRQIFSGPVLVSRRKLPIEGGSLMASNDTQDDGQVFNTPKGGLFGGPFNSSGLDPNVRATLMDFRWATSFGGSQPATRISYAFPQSANDYLAVAGYPAAALLGTFAAVTATQQSAVLSALGLVSSYTNLTFVPARSGLASDATLRFAQYTPVMPGSESRFPPNNGPYADSDSRDAGDTFLGQNGRLDTANYYGTDGFATIIHEMGHAFGLKHGHDGTYNGALAPQFNDNEFSVMTYASYLGSPTSSATEAIDGSSPQSYMMFDIAALQALYGANFSKRGTTAVYTWNAAGQEFINGTLAPSTGASSTRKIFTTVWTMGALATYDLRAFNGNQVDDLRPGRWLAFSSDQLADLNSQVTPGTPGFIAQGNVYNALLYNGDRRSEISNIMTGSGNDTIWGNDIDNNISAGAGNDTIFAGTGKDIISGGAGADTSIFSTNYDVLRDTLADLNGDVVFNFATKASLDVLGALVGRNSITIKTTGQAIFEYNGTYTTLNGNFTGGEFLVAQRGTGSTADTSLAFVPYLPALAERQRVAPSAINGIADQAFLTGDGSVQFTLNFISALSSFANELGVYQVGPDGTIHDVHVLYGDTLAVGAAQQSINLGAPDAQQRIGFFLVADGFDLYGALPDDLSFVMPGGSSPGNVNADAPPVLSSKSRGLLTAADVFHSFSAALNPDGTNQVLSGIAPGGQDLFIGFEDLHSNRTDADYNDVVVSVRASKGIG